MAFPSNTYVRNHLGLAHQWETVDGVTARGFRIDLVSLGYPIPLVTSTVRLDLEPILTVVRGELMFVTNGPRIFRMESGFSLDLSLTRPPLVRDGAGLRDRLPLLGLHQRRVVHRVLADLPAEVRDRPRILGLRARRRRREPVRAGVVLAS